MDTRPPYHHGNLPQALLDAVAATIREKGVAAVGLREAARRAGVSHGAPAHHFRDKRGLLTRYAIRGYELLVAEFVRALEGATADDPLAPLRRLGLAYVGFAVNHREYFEVMYRHELLDTSDPDFRAARDRSGLFLMDAVARAQAAGWAPGAHPVAAALAAWSLVHGLAMLWVSETLADRLADADVMAVARQTISVLLRMG